MTDVVVFPQSGYANRMQAMASAAVLADSIGARWYVCWEPQPVAPAAPLQIFDPEFVARHFVSSEEARDRWGLVKAELPLYLTVDRSANRIVVAGHDRGEQSLMPELRDLLTEHMPAAIAIVGGGKFFLSGGTTLDAVRATEFRNRRRDAYRGMAFAPEIEQAVRRAIDAQSRFVGLHLRYSDRSLEAPWRYVIWPAVRAECERLATDRVFVASDSAEERERWMRRLESRGLQPWTVRPESSDRSDPVSALGALIDWRILSSSSGMVYFAASSFAEEAAVAAGAFDTSIGLPPARSRREWMRARSFAAAAITYPRRHGWVGTR